MTLGLCGRADLVKALGRDEEVLLPTVARMLGYKVTTGIRDVEETLEPEELKQQPGLSVTEDQEEPDVYEKSPVSVDIPFWRLTNREILDPDRGLRVAVDKPDKPHVPDVKKPRTGFYPLTSWPALLPPLRQRITHSIKGPSIDTDALVERICSCRQVETIPRRRTLRWGREIQIVIDRSQHLIPYWRDQDLIYDCLCDLFPKGGIYTASYYEGLTEPIPSESSCAKRTYRLPLPGTTVFVLGDLGILDQSSQDSYRYWLALGRRLRENDSRAVALIPCPPERWPVEMRRVWFMVRWERIRHTASGAAPEDIRKRAQRLLRLISPAIRIEPALLRAARLLLSHVGADAGTESDVWQHPYVLSNSSVAATLDPKLVQTIRDTFKNEDEKTRRRFLELLYSWHALDRDMSSEIWYEEILSLDNDSQGLIPNPQDLLDAVHFFLSLDSQWTKSDQGFKSNVPGAWVRRLRARIPDRVWEDPEIGPVLQRLWWFEFQDDPDPAPPDAFDPSHMPRTDGPLQRIDIGQAGDQLVFQSESDNVTTCVSPMAQFMVQFPLIRVDTGLQDPFWRTGKPPAWADKWGQDEYGPWVEFEIKSVRQRMRWIAPGSFLMGSPEDEPERQECEGPQHEVTLSQGFWMFDTACTQALWELVMGDNPSTFKGETRRPVEQVSWDDCQEFIICINEMIPSLDLSLPTEAQWEYACRAGTATPFIFGENITPDQVNYDGNFPYANGLIGQFNDRTVPVASLPPNPWGLYEMHGNVGEWCLDGMRDYTKQVVKDPIGPMDQFAGRVVRGGSWGDSARRVRSAFRFAIRSVRRYIFGFRCLQVQQGAEAEPAGPVVGRVAEQRPARDLAGRAELVRVGASHEATSGMPLAPAFVIASDCERLEFTRIVKPPWASAIGRDRYGLWTEFELEANSAKTVTQRMRWIAPGRFLMGSPQQEAGRYGNEGPQHEVHLTQGFWLFDTPCTQALWQLVMSENPSEFKSANRPVEMVNWNECQDFVEKLNGMVPDLDLSLPSEAQWEYACRAGTTTATYAGDLEIIGEANAPLLNEIAWYGGNSGLDFDLEDGVEVSWLTDKQFDYKKGGTRLVKQKHPNPWGLYDMLGNVWEWCLDGQRKYEEKTETDPRGPMDKFPGRVVRGGSWYGHARDVRSAYHDAFIPYSRNDYLGFRCLRVQ